MPTYSYRCIECEQEFDKIVKVANRDDNQECPECGAMRSEKFISGAPAMGDTVRMGIRKIDNGFKEVLQKIHEKTPGSKLKDNSRYL